MLSDNEFDDEVLYLRLLASLVLGEAKSLLEHGEALPASLGQEVYHGMVTEPKDLDNHGCIVLPLASR